MKSGTTIHVEHNGETWQFEGMTPVDFKLTNHGPGGDAPITETYRLTSSELIELIRKHEAEATK